MTPAPPLPKPKALNCPSCGASLEQRGFAHTLAIVCPQCLAVLDAKDPNFRVLQEFQGVTRLTLKIPLGARGKWKGKTYEVIGFQQRTIDVDGVAYSWDEYLLFNPYHGYRYLTEYNGHWNDVETLRKLPQPQMSARPSAVLDGVTYKHFQTAQAETTYVLGEFPWQVRRGERVTAMDYTAPPLLLSSEITPAEEVWSLGRYTQGAEIWKAFGLPGEAPRPYGIFVNQPNPHGERTQTIWRLFLLFLTLGLIAMMGLAAMSRNEIVFSQKYSFSPMTRGEASFVTPVFELKGHPANVVVETRTDLSNSWAYFSFALINEESGTALDFGREVSYYFGRDSDGSWSEGSAGDTAVVPSVPAGRYYLRVEPEMDPRATSLNYELRVRHDVVRWGYFWLAAILLLIPPVLATIRRYSFEHQRWQESDYSSGTSSSSDSDSDSDGDDE